MGPDRRHRESRRPRLPLCRRPRRRHDRLRGFNIWPAELEHVIAELPGVREVVVVGVPHEKWGEAPLAVVFADTDAELTQEVVIEACRTALGSYKKPTRVVFRDEAMPRSPVGKIQRKVIREPFW